MIDIKTSVLNVNYPQKFVVYVDYALRSHYYMATSKISNINTTILIK
jgi:hypothetical protein